MLLLLPHPHTIPHLPRHLMGVAWVQELLMREIWHPVEPQPLSEGLLEPCLANRTVLAPGQS